MRAHDILHIAYVSAYIREEYVNGGVEIGGRKPYSLHKDYMSGRTLKLSTYFTEYRINPHTLLSHAQKTYALCPFLCRYACMSRLS